MSEETKAQVDLTDFKEDARKDGDKPAGRAPAKSGSGQRAGEEPTRMAADLEAVFDIPVKIAAVLGRTQLEVSEILRLAEGDVVELDRKVGEAIDIFVNNRLVARGEVVLVEDRLGVTMTEIIKSERTA